MDTTKPSWLMSSPLIAAILLLPVLARCGGGTPAVDAGAADDGHAELLSTGAVDAEDASTPTADGYVDRYVDHAATGGVDAEDASTPTTDGDGVDATEVELPCAADVDGWCQVVLPAAVERLATVWGATSDRVWLAGTRGTLLGWNGRDFTAQPSGTTASLARVWGTTADDVWAVGDGVILHWNGAAWTTLLDDSSTRFSSVWGSDATHVWMVGSGGTGPLVMTWNGTTLRPQALSFALDGGSADGLIDVWGASPTDVWAISGTSLYRFDGASFTDVSSQMGAYCAGPCHAIWGADASHVWIASGFRAPGYVGRWDGTTWASASVKGDQLLGLWGRGASEVWAVGGYGGGYVTRWDGATWTQQKTASEALSAVWGSKAGDLWVVGGSTVLYRRP
jgi:hypothetical protein